MAKLFSLPKNKRFSYKPLYYNERDEKRKEREERIRKEVEAEKLGQPVRLTREDMSDYFKLARRTQKKSNIRLLLIMALLLAIAYFFFYK